VRRPRELAFRFKQELANLRLWRFPSSLSSTPQPPKLPAAIEQLEGTAFAAEVLRLAGEIACHRFPIFGGTIDTGPEIRWRRDYVHHTETGTPYFRRISYLDFPRVGDHKYIWELSRHQHLVVLAQAYRLSGNPEHLLEAQRQLESWMAQNPPLRGINWASALEVAFRALSWVWLDGLAGHALPPAFRRAFLQSLYLHGCFLERNLSVYFSPNTHLLGEAVALHTLGTLYPEFPRSPRWRRLGAELAAQQMNRQVRDDGAHFEQSTYYHVYALDFFLWHELLGQTSEPYREKLLRMGEYLDALLGPAGRIPFFGDDDGGRVFHPYGNRAAFGRASLATCGVYFGRPEWIRSPDDLAEQAAWWVGHLWDRGFRPAAGLPPGVPPVKSNPPRSRLFPESGIAIMTAGDAHIVIKAGGFGPTTAGHSHSDALSFVCSLGSSELLVDSGTYTYLADPAWRNRFRVSAAHNTIRIDGKDQATPAGPFRWNGRPEVRIHEWRSAGERDFLDAECRYSGFRHRRRFQFLKPDVLLVLDTVEGPPGDHLVEQFWHAASPDTFARMAFSQASESIEAWHSPVFGSKEAAAARRSAYRGPLPVMLAAGISFDGQPEALTLEESPEVVTLHFRGGLARSALF
jgi:heparinase II/III-like protein